jgi:hypothetical protein
MKDGDPTVIDIMCLQYSSNGALCYTTMPLSSHLSQVDGEGLIFNHTVMRSLYKARKIKLDKYNNFTTAEDSHSNTFFYDNLPQE